MPKKETGNKKKVFVTKEDIKRGLKRLGLKKGDVIGVHSSLSSFGYVEGGADTVIDVLLEIVGKEGTIVMPTYSTNRKKMRRTPREIKLGVTWKYKILTFDPKKTPCWTGKISETFRKRKRAVRNLNPIHSLAAIGQKAKKLVQGWNKLLEEDGYILLLGVDLGCCSAMHLADYVQLPKRILKKITPPQELLEKYGPDLGWPKWDIGYGPYPNFLRMERPCREHGIMKTVKIGKTTVKLLRLRKLIELYVKYLKKDPDVFYKGK